MTDFLGEIRVRTKYPDTDGSAELDWFPSNGTVHANNVNAAVINYTED
jgi:hypothetical protein